MISANGKLKIGKNVNHESFEHSIDNSAFFINNTDLLFYRQSYACSAILVIEIPDNATIYVHHEKIEVNKFIITKIIYTGFPKKPDGNCRFNGWVSSFD